MNYEVLSEPVSTKYGHLFQLRATKDFLNIKKGELGGLISDEAFLNPESECWVERGSFLLGKSSVTGNVIIQNQSVIDSCKIDCTNADITNSNLIGCIIRGEAKIARSALHGCIVSSNDSCISDSVLNYVALGVQSMPRGRYTLAGVNVVSGAYFQDGTDIQGKNELLVVLYNDTEYLIYPLEDNKVHIFNCRGKRMTNMKELRAKVHKVASAVSARLKGRSKYG